MERTTLFGPKGARWKKEAGNRKGIAPSHLFPFDIDFSRERDDKSKMKPNEVHERNAM